MLIYNIVKYSSLSVSRNSKTVPVRLPWWRFTKLFGISRISISGRKFNVNQLMTEKSKLAFLSNILPIICKYIWHHSNNIILYHWGSVCNIEHSLKHYLFACNWHYQTFPLLIPIAQMGISRVVCNSLFND